MYFDPNMRSNSKFALITAALLLMLASPVARAEIRFYVAPSGSDAQNGTSPAQPFLTVQRAQQAVRELKQRGPLTEPVTVYLSEGVYPISEALKFTPEDSGTETCPITYKAAQGEKALLSGGRKVTGWKRYKGNIWVATLPEVQAGEWWFRQLYVNGNLRGRARTPNQGVFEIKATTDTTTSQRSRERFVRIQYRRPGSEMEASRKRRSDHLPLLDRYPPADQGYRRQTQRHLVRLPVG